MGCCVSVPDTSMVVSRVDKNTLEWKLNRSKSWEPTTQTEEMRILETWTNQDDIYDVVECASKLDQAQLYTVMFKLIDRSSGHVMADISSSTSEYTSHDGKTIPFGNLELKMYELRYEKAPTLLAEHFMNQRISGLVLSATRSIKYSEYVAIDRNPIDRLFTLFQTNIPKVIWTRTRLRPVKWTR